MRVYRNTIDVPAVQLRVHFIDTCSTKVIKTSRDIGTMICTEKYCNEIKSN